MVEFKQASTGTEVSIAHIADATVYLFRSPHMPHPRTWWLTCNRLNITGQCLGEGQFEDAKIEALKTLSSHALRQSEVLAAMAAECAEEANTAQKLKRDLEAAAYMAKADAGK